MKEVIIYGRSNPPCPYCESAKKALDAEDIQYIYRDIVDPVFQEEHSTFGVRTVPVVVVDGVNMGGADSIQNTITVILEEDKPVQVLKRNGTLEDLDIAKIDTVLDFMAEGLDVSVSQVAMKSHIQFFDGITSDTIHSTLVKSAADLISLENPDYQYMAARGLIFQLRKKAYGEYTPPKLIDHIRKMISLGKYDAHIMEDYSESDLNYLESVIDHERDLTFAYAGVKQLEGKYLVQDRTTGEIFESPQMLYMLVAMCLFSKYPTETRLKYVEEFYHAISQFKISLPTPIMGGVRTPTRQFSSCFPAGQKVYTESGLVSIENVSEGTKVLTKGGTFEEVLLNSAKISETEGFVSLRNQFSIPWDFESTSDHRIMAIKKKHKDSLKNYDVSEWVEAGGLEVGDFVKIPFNSHVLNKEYIDVPVPDGYAVSEGYIKKVTTDPRKRSGDFDDKVKPVPEKIKISYDFMKILGYFLAEGHVNKNTNSIGFTFSVEEKGYHKDVIDYFKTLGLPCSVHNTDKNATGIVVHSLPIKELILSLVGTGFDKKVLSDTIMRVHPDLQKGLLVGVIRGDGCVHKNGMTLGMCNRTLVHQIALICLRNGLYPSLGYRKTEETDSSYSVSEVYTLNLSKGANYSFLKTVGKSLDKLESYELKGNNYGLAKYKDGDYYAKILELKVRDNNQEIVYDLSVDNDHSFTVSGVGVHNCVLIESGDDLDSINATSGAIVKYVSQRAGIGVNAGRIRALGSSIRNGEATHTGCIPFFKHFQTAVKSCSQGGLRGGAATLFYPLWHLEVESLLVLKNNRGVEENRVRHLDYGVQFNKLMYQRLIKGQDITLFSPSDVEGLYDAFFEDQEKFERLYIKAESDPSIRKKTVKAIELFTLFANERASTGRIYLQNVDHCNTNSPFDPSKAAIRQSNLCLEIALPTKPLDDVKDPKGEVALCTLSAFNLGVIDSLDELEGLADLTVRALDSLLDYQDYPLPAAKNSSLNRRTLGVGLVNYAYWLAKQNLTYSGKEGNNATHELMEAMQYYLMKASMLLAKEKGACPKFNETTMAQGILPIDRYKEEVDTVHNQDLKMDWDGLREDILKYGVRNSTVSALMPSETSSQVSNATNGIEPPRGLLSVKASKDGILKQVVPSYKEHKEDYELLWDIPDNQGYLEKVAIMQKFVDQTISANTNYDPAKFPNGKVPIKQILKDMLTAYKLGVKTFYYHNTRDGATDEVEVEDDSCSGGACKI